MVLRQCSKYISSPPQWQILSRHRLLPQNCFSSWWQILAEVTLPAWPYLTSLPPHFCFKQSWPHGAEWCRICLAGLPPGSLFLQISFLFSHQPSLCHKLTCSQSMNTLINPLFEQYDSLIICFPGVANTKNGVGGFAVICTSFISACCYTISFSPFLPLFLSPCL